MKILITGSKGFIGKNLIDALNKKGGYEIYEFDIDTPTEKIQEFTKDCEFVFNFAAVHRPKEESEFDATNHLFFDDLLKMLEQNNNACPVLYTSSIQATNGTAYGKSKLLAEKDLKDYGQRNNVRVVIYRLSNTYGRWAMPNHHSVVATFCYNLANGLPIQVNDESIQMNFYYIEDVIDSFMSQLENPPCPDSDGIFRLSNDKIHTITLGDLAKTLKYFKECIDQGTLPEFNSDKEQNLFQTLKSYLD